MYDYGRKRIFKKNKGGGGGLESLKTNLYVYGGCIPPNGSKNDFLTKCSDKKGVATIAPNV